MRRVMDQAHLHARSQYAGVTIAVGDTLVNYTRFKRIRPKQFHLQLA